MQSGREQSYLAEIFELSTAAELTTAKIYELLSRRFVHAPETRALFTMLSQEELSHARRIEQFAKKLADCCPTATATDAQLVPIRLAVLTASNMRGRIATRPISEGEAFDIAGHLEEKLFANLHAEMLARQQNPLLALMFDELAEWDRGHAELLKRRKLSLPEARLAAVG
jgi:rubrerythrin